MTLHSEFEHLFSQQQYRNILFTDEPILFINHKKLEDTVKNFTSDFPGMTLYAVKCNPHPAVITALVEIGIDHFDTASLAEIQLVKSILPTAKCYFNHPIKTRAAIRSAYYDYGVRDFVIDSRDEWEKLASEIDVTDIVIQLRLDTKTGSRTYDFSQKFGMGSKELLLLAIDLSSQGICWALSFHVGSQCEDPTAYSIALKLCKTIIEKTDIKPKYINVGGGFPGHYPGSSLPCIEKYFDEIRQSQHNFNLPPLLCEPGRALVCHAGSLIVQVLARKDNKLYINDGVYGALAEVNYAKLRLNAMALSLHSNLSNNYREFIIFGPTCDSFDTLEYRFNLPENVSEGDWLVIFDLGAYSTSLSSQFNGFISNRVLIGEISKV